MKICVYAICKNESQFVDRWMKSVSEADQIVVLDTGSADDTAQRLRDAGATVYQTVVKPWRFDVARNMSLDLVPSDVDVCICIDLDEILQPGWRKALEEQWTPDMRQGQFFYIWSFDAEGNPDVTFWREKIHTRYGFRWVHPVHEVLEWTGPGEAPKIEPFPNVVVEHHPDMTKSRSNYLELLELAASETPEDDRTMHYLGREYMYAHRWEDAIRTLKQHLMLPSATWFDERSASMRYIGKCYMQLGDLDEALVWYTRATQQAPYLREPYIDKAPCLYVSNFGKQVPEDWEELIRCVNTALGIQERPQSYISEGYAWNTYPYELLVRAHYYLHHKDEVYWCIGKILGDAIF